MDSKRCLSEVGGGNSCSGEVEEPVSDGLVEPQDAPRAEARHRAGPADFCRSTSAHFWTINIEKVAWLASGRLVSGLSFFLTQVRVPRNLMAFASV